MRGDNVYSMDDITLKIGDVEIKGLASADESEFCSYCDNGREDECVFGCALSRAIRESQDQ